MNDRVNEAIKWIRAAIDRAPPSHEALMVHHDDLLAMISDLEQARQEIRAGLAEARSQLRPQAEQIAREAAARVLGRSLS